MAEYFGRGKRSRLKDKKVNLVRKTTVKETPYPHEYYKIVEGGGNIWAYYRAASQLEISYAETTAQAITSIFFLNWRSDIRNDDFIEYKGNFYKIEFLDDFEGYKEDIKVTAKAIDKLPAVDEDGTPTKQAIKAPTDLVAELQEDRTVKLYWTDQEDTALSVTYWYVNYKTEGGEWLENDAGSTETLGGYLHITDIYSEIGDKIRLKLFPIESYSDSYTESPYSEVVEVFEVEKTKLEAATGFAAETLESGGVVLTWEHSTDEDKATYTLSLNEGAYNQEITTGLTDETYTHEAGKGGDIYELTAMPTTESSRFYRKSDSVQVTAEKIPLIKLGDPSNFEAVEQLDGGVVLTWDHGSEHEKGLYTLLEAGNAPYPDDTIKADLTENTYTHKSGYKGTVYKLTNIPIDPEKYEQSETETATATKEAAPDKVKLGTVTDFEAVELEDGGVLLTWLNIADYEHATYKIMRNNAPMPDYEVVSDLQAQQFTDTSGGAGDRYNIVAVPIDPIYYETGAAANATATEYQAPSKIQYPKVTNFTVDAVAANKLNRIRFTKIPDDVVDGVRWAEYEVQKQTDGNEWENISTDPRSNFINDFYPEKIETYRVVVVTNEHSEATHTDSEPTETITVENNYK